MSVLKHSQVIQWFNPLSNLSVAQGTFTAALNSQ